MIKKSMYVLGVLCILVPGTIVRAQEDTEQTVWQTRAELSYVKTSGNSDNENLSGKLGAKSEGMVNRYYGKASVYRAKDRNEETADKWLVDGRWERILHDRLFAFLGANYQKDKFSGYKYRIGGGPGVGYDLIKTEKHTLKGLASVLYYYDKYSRGNEDSNDYVAGKAAIEYEWRIWDNLRFKENADYLVSFKDTQKYFINSETAVEIKIKDKVSLGISYIINYQNDPPFEDIKQTDRMFLTSLIIDF